MKSLMSGNEAAARGAFEAGVKVCSAYPGTPSTEVFENLPQYGDDLYCEWAPNEKVAAEVAYGASIAGARSLCAMKHVGVNVAADPLFTAAYNGAGAGFVIITADDPSMHSSQNEQDNRLYSKFAKIPMIEPSNSQECKDFMIEAFKISEMFEVPVFFRMTTRVCHSKSLVEEGKRTEAKVVEYRRNVPKFVSTPANARLHHVDLEKKLSQIEEYSNQSSLNSEEMNGSELGIVTSSISYEYAKEVFEDKASYLKISICNPLPMAKIKDFAGKVKRLIVIEELEPFMEDQMKAAGIKCEGKNMTGKLFELNPELIRERILGQKAEFIVSNVKPVGRPPALCPGCPHRGFFYTLSRKSDYVICGDIGCYTLGCAPPLGAMDSCVCMGGGFSVAHGMSKAFQMNRESGRKVFGVMGDSTFFHSGMTGAVEILYNKGAVIPCVLDNRITGMTGHQDNPGSGYDLMGREALMIDIEKVLVAFGYENVITVDPQDLKAMQKAVDDALGSDVPAAIICKRPCLLIKRMKHDISCCAVDSNKCRGCRSCLKIGCPAIAVRFKKAFIDPTLCTGCTVCAQVCPFDAISKEAR
ncbi:MAG: indolepyruvate ferredoxin oxidoreductase subunit alpha [Sphaerochaetaceae bacterium]|nr:indolepyruvate ferredoxin oxidoreductase subunit alpha [Sphaerochaetaceae bacterium]NLY07735.1 indolepyruvate ferredoxin oxidoreductase subunit alpha [Spirochaetales bacterium]